MKEKENFNRKPKNNSKHPKKTKKNTEYSKKNLILSVYTDKIVIKLGGKNDLELFVGNVNYAEPSTKGSFCFFDNQSLCEANECEWRDDVKFDWRYRKKGGCKMIGVVSAANYLISLFYNSNRYCRSAVIQKLLVIAQMDSILKDDELLFCDDIIVKESCFSIDFISKTYPNVIFDGEYEEQNEMFPDDELLIAQEIAQPNCFYKVYDITEREKNILRRTYQKFGRYSGDCIGKAMCALSLHGQYYEIGTIKSNTELRDYLNNIPIEDMENPIVSFVTDDNQN